MDVVVLASRGPICYNIRVQRSELTSLSRTYLSSSNQRGKTQHRGCYEYAVERLNMAETITAEMIIHDIVTTHPETVKVFHGHGLPCTACAIGARESVAGGARTHRFAPEKLALLLQDLNAAANGLPTSVAPKKAPVGRGVPLTMAPAGKDGNIKQVIAIMSGKGGVGKSLVTGLLAVSLRRQGLKVGILDGDITGPSIARMFGTRGQPNKSASGGIEPLSSMGGISIMSMNMFLESESSPVVWRGPMVSSAIKQFYSDVDL